jgi:hypothetical protein
MQKRPYRPRLYSIQKHCIPVFDKTEHSFDSQGDAWSRAMIVQQGTRNCFRSSGYKPDTSGHNDHCCPVQRVRTADIQNLTLHPNIANVHVSVTVEASFTRPTIAFQRLCILSRVWRGYCFR